MPYYQQTRRNNKNKYHELCMLPHHFHDSYHSILLAVPHHLSSIVVIGIFAFIHIIVINWIMETEIPSDDPFVS